MLHLEDRGAWNLTCRMGPRRPDARDGDGFKSGVPESFAMSVSGSPFCEHKKLRTGCAICKPAALPAESGLKATPYVSQDEREKVAEKKEKKVAEAKARGDPAPAKTVRPTGPGKPLLPSRNKKKQSISAKEADAAKPWWVKGP